MLDIMRRANRQKWFLGIIVIFVVFSFVMAVFAIWGGAATLEDPGGFGWAARVDGVEIPVSELERQRQQLQTAYQNLLGERFDADAYALTLYRQAGDQLITQELAFRYASRLGLGAADDEVARAIRTAPVFQRAGRFIGREQYINELRARGYDPESYEDAIRRQIAVDKLRDYVATLHTISKEEEEKAWRERGETVEADYAHLASSGFEPAADAKEAELKNWFEDHREDYLTAERRRASYIVIERAPVLESIQVADEEIRSFYDENLSRYAIPAQWNASHILFEVPAEARDEEIAQVEKKAREVLDQIRAGADFAEIAQLHSQDTTSASRGGDLGWFERGTMVPEFDSVAFSLGQGETSDLVRTQFGFHIIRLTGAREAGTRPLEEARDGIRQQLAFRQAQSRLEAEAARLKEKLDLQISSFEGTATEMGYTVSDTGLFSRDEPLGDLGVQPRAALEAFRMSRGDVSQPIPITTGLLFLRLDGISAPVQAAYEDVRDRVLADFNNHRALTRARAAAKEIADAGFDGFKEAADRKKVEVHSRDEFTRGTAPADLTPAILDQIFAASAGEVIGPIDGESGVVVVKVLKRGPATPEEGRAARERVLTELRDETTDRAWRAVIQTASRKASIEENSALWGELTSRYTPAAR